MKRIIIAASFLVCATVLSQGPIGPASGGAGSKGLKSGPITTPDTNADNMVAPTQPSHKSIVIQEAPFQTANLFEIQTTNGTPIAGFNNVGQLFGITVQSQNIAGPFGATIPNYGLLSGGASHSFDTLILPNVSTTPQVLAQSGNGIGANPAAFVSFVTGTSGSDFNINGVTFNLPTASASNRGALSSSDWSTFNAKLGTSAIGSTVQAFNSNTTTAGNTFNGANQLVQLTAATKYPAIDGSLLTNLTGANVRGTGYDGSGSHALFDDGTFKSVAGGGSVVDVAVTAANGVSATSDHNATTPHLTFTLGAIAPSSIAATGTVTGSNLSGTNTGDQTITLTGNVTGSGTGTFAATIANNAVTYAQLQQISQTALLGNAAGGGNAVEIPLRGGQSFVSGKLDSFNASQSLSGTSPTVDASLGKSFYLDPLTGNTTFTFSGFNDGDSIVIRCKQAASGGPYTVTFPSSTWQGGSQPTQTTTASKSDFYQFTKQGTTIYANASQNY